MKKLLTALLILASLACFAFGGALGCFLGHVIGSVAGVALAEQI